MRRLASLFAILLLGGAVVSPRPARGQSGARADSLAVIAVADSLLRALSTNDTAALRRLSLDSALVGGVGTRGTQEVLSLRSMRGDIARGLPAFVERGFNPTALVSGWIAVVWMPYDLYRSGAWSHCGVDTFTLLKVGGAWRLASLLFTIEQPPACAKHPAGPPATASARPSP
jgi:hypothetical protein